ncbi:GNAT family N-acetyltransferase [Oscillospiraceae bacterium OttesenSCG-928-G22]|nr:GNAT family N-acetyltransferase [Oscillospiraceae bacterium OttesenSCG-928-G22]
MIELLTPRLRIRDHVESDLETHHELLSDERAMRYIRDIACETLDESHENLSAAIRDIANPDRKFYFLRIEDRETGAHIGEIGYTITDRNPAGAIAEVGYFLRPEHWGRGYATEAFRELIRFAFAEGGVYRICCGCSAKNRASEAVMQKCGLILEGVLKDHHWHDGGLCDRLLYRVLKSEWRG